MSKIELNKVDIDLGKIELRFGKIVHEIDTCALSEIAKDIVIIVDHARAMKENGLIPPTKYLNIIDRVNDNIDIAKDKCICKKR